jgi:GT2 family glycosyltransferase
MGIKNIILAINKMDLVEYKEKKYLHILEDYKKLGSWDEFFWMYYEDIDLSKRAAQLGMKRVLLNNWHCIHNHGGASRKNISTTILTKSEVIISSHKYIQKHFGDAAKLIAHSFIFTTTFLELGLLSLFSKVKRGMFKKLLGYWFGAKA